MRGWLGYDPRGVVPAGMEGSPRSEGSGGGPPAGRGPSRRLKAVAGRPLSPAVGLQDRGWDDREGHPGGPPGADVRVLHPLGRGSHCEWLRRDGLCKKGERLFPEGGTPPARGALYSPQNHPSRKGAPGLDIPWV